jgi:hypothetical protein
MRTVNGASLFCLLLLCTCSNPVKPPSVDTYADSSIDSFPEVITDLWTATDTFVADFPHSDFDSLSDSHESDSTEPDSREPDSLDVIDLVDLSPDEVTCLSTDDDEDGLDDCEEVALGTDPTVWDSDTDGISDGQEVSDGTSPLDPADALLWHPEWSGRPRLVFGPDDLPVLRQRLLAPPELHNTMLNRVRSAAGSAPVDSNSEEFHPSIEATRAKAAMAAAFMALLEEDELAAIASYDTIMGLNPNVEEMGFASPYYNISTIHIGEALAYYAKAFDYLAAAGFQSEDEMESAENLLADLTNRFEASCTGGPMAALLMLAQNNHNIKAFGGIGLMGMALSHRPEAARWINLGMTNTVFTLLDFQTTTDGAYAEGPSYLNYGMGEGLSLLHAWHRFAAGAPFLMHYKYNIMDGTGPQFDWLQDPAVSPLLLELYRWPIRLMLPGGLAPNIDDSHLEAMASGYLAAFFNDPVFLWHWQQPDNGLRSHAGIELASDIFALLSPELEPQPPDWPLDQFLASAGNCVVRSGLAPDDSYMLLLAEYGKPRTHGQGHEHADGLQLLLDWAGEHLLIDAGYVHWNGKDIVSQPENHNLILVDGIGPPNDELTGIGSDTLPGELTGTDDVRGCGARTSYNNVSFVRRVLWVEDTTVAVLDEIVADEEHEYSLLWHGNGGGDSGGEFALVNNSGVWSRPSAAIRATVFSTVPVTCEEHEMNHSFSYGSKLTHSMMKCQASGSKVLFLTIFTLDKLNPVVPIDIPAMPLSTVGAYLSVNGKEISLAGRFEDGFAASVSGGCAPFNLEYPLTSVLTNNLCESPEPTVILEVWPLPEDL